MCPLKTLRLQLWLRLRRHLRLFKHHVSYFKIFKRLNRHCILERVQGVPRQFYKIVSIQVPLSLKKLSSTLHYYATVLNYITLQWSCSSRSSPTALALENFYLRHKLFLFLSGMTWGPHVAMARLTPHGSAPSYLSLPDWQGKTLPLPVPSASLRG